jgi:hypothetical protein
MKEFAAKIDAHGNIIPVDVHDKILLTQELKQGKTYKCKLTNSRNIKHLGKYWLLMKALAFHFPSAADTNTAWHEYYKYKFLPLIEFNSKEGKMLFPSSIAFDKMDQLEFDEYYKKVDNFLLESGYNIDELINTMVS